MRVLALCLLVACGGSAPAPDPVEVALRRGGAFLVTRQQADGAFRSRTYSALRDGWSETPLVTLALRMTPPEPVIASTYRKGVEYVASMAAGGRVRQPPEVSYPLHAYAIGALVLGAPENRDGHKVEHEALIAAVTARQLRPPMVPEGDPSVGGWGYAIDPTKPDPASGEAPNANLSATILAIGAIALRGGRLDEATLAQAQVFVASCQNPDGGFVFSRTDLTANKAGLEDGKPRSYGSMTADGLRGLIRLGRPLEDPDVRRAAAWLDENFDATKNPGAFGPADEVRGESSYFYWAWTAAHAARHLNRRDWAQALIDELVRRQLPDGSWRNGATEMREDDPLVATPFAIAALAISKSVLDGQPKSHAY